MLSFESPAFTIEGIIVYRDHAVPTQFYYAAPAPKLSRTNGRTIFDLLTYSVDLKHSPLAGTAIPDELGAGFLTLGVDCGLSDTQQRTLLSGISDRTQFAEEQIMLAPIPYHKGTVRVLALDQFAAPNEPPAAAASTERLKGRPTFVEKIIGSNMPALLGDLRSIFSLGLSQEGVTFLQGLYASQAAPIGVVYDLKFYGLRPAIEAKVTANLSRIYQHFGGGLSGQYQWFKADIEAGLGFLLEQSAIQIELTTQATGDEAQKSKDLALSLFRERIVQEMFRPITPAVPNSQANALANAIGNTAKLSLTLKFQRTEELKTVTYDFRERSPEERTHAPQAFLPLLLSATEFQKRVHQVDLRNDFFELLQVLLTSPTKDEFETLNIRQVEATLTYGDASDGLPIERQTLLFRPDSLGDKTFAVKRRGRKSLAYQCALTYEFNHTSAIDSDRTRYELPERTCTSRTLRINPYDDFGVLDVEVEPGRLHPDIKEVDVQLAYHGDRFQADDAFRFAVGSAVPKHHWQVRTQAALATAYTATYTFTFQDGSVYTAATLACTDPLLRVDSPFKLDRRLLIQPNIASLQVTQVTVELEYSDITNKYERRFLATLEPPFTNKDIRFPILDPNQQMVRYRVMVSEPGFISEGEWLKTSDPSIVVGAAESRISTVTIRLVGPVLSTVGLDAVQFTLELENATDSHNILFDGTQTSQDVKFALPPGQTLHYRYRTTAFRSDGQIVESPDWKTGLTNLLLVISTRTF